MVMVRCFSRRVFQYTGHPYIPKWHTPVRAAPCNSVDDGRSAPRRHVHNLLAVAFLFQSKGGAFPCDWQKFYWLVNCFFIPLSITAKPCLGRCLSGKPLLNNAWLIQSVSQLKRRWCEWLLSCLPHPVSCSRLASSLLSPDNLSSILIALQIPIHRH